jgi:hypothetical protein
MTLAQRLLTRLQSWIARGAVRRSIWTRAVFAFGRLHAPFLRPSISEADITRALATVRPGDVLAVYTRRYLSSALIPGRHKHTAIYTGNGWVIHAAAPKVHQVRLVEFLRVYDRAAVWRPRYAADVSSWKAIDRAAFCAIGTGYDPLFCDKNDLWYCHEFVAHCLGAAGLVVCASGPQFVADDIAEVCDQVLEVGR